MFHAHHQQHGPAAEARSSAFGSDTQPCRPELLDSLDTLDTRDAQRARHARQLTATTCIHNKRLLGLRHYGNRQCRSCRRVTNPPGERRQALGQRTCPTHSCSFCRHPRGEARHEAAEHGHQRRTTHGEAPGDPAGVQDRHGSPTRRAPRRQALGQRTCPNHSCSFCRHPGLGADPLSAPAVAHCGIPADGEHIHTHNTSQTAAGAMALRTLSSFMLLPPGPSRGACWMRMRSSAMFPEDPRS